MTTWDFQWSSDMGLPWGYLSEGKIGFWNEFTPMIILARAPLTDIVIARLSR
jgi:hypothetical protein